MFKEDAMLINFNQLTAISRDKARLEFAFTKCPAIFQHIIMPLLDRNRADSHDAVAAAKRILRFLEKIDPCPEILEQSLLQEMQIAQADPMAYMLAQDKIMAASEPGSTAHDWAQLVVEFTFVAEIRFNHIQAMKLHCQLMLSIIFSCLNQARIAEN